MIYEKTLPVGNTLEIEILSTDSGKIGSCSYYHVIINELLGS